VNSEFCELRHDGVLKKVGCRNLHSHGPIPMSVLTHNGFLRVRAAPKNTHAVPDLAYLASPGEHPRGDQANLLRPFRLAAAVPGTVLKGIQLLFQGCGDILRAILELVGVLAQIVELFFAALVADVDPLLAAHA
jgi:hypothetical protein